MRFHWSLQSLERSNWLFEWYSGGSASGDLSLQCIARPSAPGVSLNPYTAHSSTSWSGVDLRVCRSPDNKQGDCLRAVLLSEGKRGHSLSEIKTHSLRKAHHSPVNDRLTNKIPLKCTFNSLSEHNSIEDKTTEQPYSGAERRVSKITRCCNTLLQNTQTHMARDVPR